MYLKPVKNYSNFSAFSNCTVMDTNWEELYFYHICASPGLLSSFRFKLLPPKKATMTYYESTKQHNSELCYPVYLEDSG